MVNQDNHKTVISPSWFRYDFLLLEVSSDLICFFLLFSKDFVVNADMFYKMHSDWEIRLPYDINAVNLDVVLFDLQNTLLHTS